MVRPSSTGGKTGKAKASNASPAKGRETIKTKRRIAPAATRRVKRRSVSGPSKDLEEAREQQAATAEILKVIASSPSDVQPVFDAIATSANRLIGGLSTAVFRFVDGSSHLAAFTPGNPAADAVLKASFPRPIAGFQPFDLAQTGEVQIADTESSAAMGIRDIARARGFRSALVIPLMSNGAPLGVISVTRLVPGSFAPHHVQLLQTFADQAVIAIENVRLFNETKEALARQTATSDILRVISQSPTDVQPVFDAIVLAAVRLIRCDIAFFLRCDATTYTAVARATPEGLQASIRPPEPIDPGANFPSRAIVAKETLHLPDWSLVELPEYERRIHEVFGVKSSLYLPLQHRGECIGLLALAGKRANIFGESEIALAESFRDQAVIAIENTQLFKEVKARTEDLSESLQQQTATADVLKVISRSAFDLPTVLQTLVESAARLCDADKATITRQKEGVFFRAESYGLSNEFMNFIRTVPVVPDRGSAGGRTLLEGIVVHIPDVRADSEYTFTEAQRLGDFRAILSVPMLREGVPIGILALMRSEVRPFSNKQIELVTTFADQAAIAIENVRLFDEVQAKTRDLTESLEQQTATSEVLQVISSSQGELDPVFQTMLESATRVCGASFGTMNLWDGEKYNIVAVHNIPPAFAEYRQRAPIVPHPGSSLAIVVETHQPVQVPDLRESPGYKAGVTNVVGLADIAGARTILVVPMLKDDEILGAITIIRQEVKPFTDKQVALVENFTKQAVIAIENTRLLKELRQRTDDLSESLQQQTATADVLKVISRSTFDLQPVLDTLISSACRLCQADIGTIRYQDGSTYPIVADFGCTPEWRDNFASYSKKPDRGSIFGRTVVDGRTVHMPDVLADPEFARMEAQKLVGFRAALGVPLIREGQVFGVINLLRFAPRSFTEKQIELVETFADQAVIAIGNVQLFEEVQARTLELTESLEQQTATAEVLGVISSSAGDLEPVFDKMLENATRVCGAEFGSMFLVEGDALRQAALYNAPAALAAARINKVRPIHPRSAINAAIRSKQVVHIEDVSSTPAYFERAPAVVELVELAGARTIVVVPMLRDEEAIGVITVYRQEVRPFGDKQVDLLTNFARQAVIAIENARLLRELRQRTDDLSEALVFQTGSSNILKVIASSPSDVSPALKAIVDSAREICEAYDAAVLLKDGRDLLMSAHHGPIPPGFERAPINRNWVAGRAVADRAPQHVHDLLGPEGDDFPEARHIGGRRQGLRTVLSVPLLREGEAIGAIALRRIEVNPFTDKQIALLQTFADQAVIAVENARLFNETQEALERQTATADILKVIASSPSDVQPVFEAIATSSNRLIGGFSSSVHRVIDDLDHLVAFTPTNPESDEVLKAAFPRHRSEMPAIISLVEKGETGQIVDSETADWQIQKLARARGWRSATYTPLMNQGTFIGFIVCTRRETGMLADHHVQLLRTFADQAVIAIENARLFNETQEALERQIATAEILRVIARSPSDTQPVFEAIATSANRLLAGYSTAVFRLFDGTVHLAAFTPTNPTADEALKADFPKPVDAFEPLQLTRPGEPFPIPDTEEIPYAPIREIARLHGFRSMLFIPLMNGGLPIGVISVTRAEPGAFAPHHVQLLQTFADQAVIAIENVRLFDEVQAKTADLSESLQQQTATADVLKVISRSTFDLQTVLDTLLRSAARLCEADQGTITKRKGESFYRAVSHGYPEAFMEYAKDLPVEVGRHTGTGRALLEGKVVHIPDVEADPEYTWKQAQQLGGFRTMLGVPMLREAVPVGVLTLTRTDVRPFTEKQIELVATFADQAAIAIENVRLFESAEARTRELAKSLEDLQKAQDRLVQTEKLASLGQLTAGIAHEIKNPLNFVNNFSALSAELTDELNDALRPVAMDGKVREEVDELTGMLKGNLEKVVQHGKRADAIVKNMLLHSREGSREHRPADINSLLDESLNLAYHGARAEKGEFNITLQRDFDADAGTIELFPQEITRAFLNLIANGVYAATRRKTENKEPGFEPTLRATTKNLGTTVEIRIRDNGTGIPAEVQQKMFNPFFTTKPAGEGTGLGLSMTHDIIVKQHGGRIDVATELGQFTEFIIVLPRMAATGKAGADK